MPDWNSKDLIKIKKFALLFTKAMNDKKISQLKSVYNTNANMHRGMENSQGLPDIIKWYRKMWNEQGYRNAKFILKDASAGIMPNGSAKCILWFEINVPGRKQNAAIKPKSKQIHIESLDLELFGKQWKAVQCFGIGYDPKAHGKYF